MGDMVEEALVPEFLNSALCVNPTIEHSNEVVCAREDELNMVCNENLSS